MATPYQSLFDHFAETITPDSTRAIILLEESSRQSDWQKARKLLARISAESPDYELMRSAYPALVIFRLKPEHLSEAVLKLTENGYNRLKAINAQMHSGLPKAPT
jgi:hypothetical protein